MAAKFVVDTCVWSQLSKDKGDSVVEHWLQNTSGLAIPIAAIIEMQKGLFEKPWSKDSLQLMDWFERLIASPITVLSTGLTAARVYGAMLARKELRSLWCQDAGSGTTRGSQDLHIAAAAITHGIPVATNNVRHFRMIDRQFPLPGLYDPSSAIWHIEANQGRCIAGRNDSLLSFGAARVDV